MYVIGSENKTHVLPTRLSALITIDWSISEFCRILVKRISLRRKRFTDIKKNFFICLTKIQLIKWIFYEMSEFH